MSTERVLVTGAGGFIGGWLVRQLSNSGVANIRAIDIKESDAWFQHTPGVEESIHDLRNPDACKHACREVDIVYNLACDMGGIGYIESHKAECMLSVLINTNMLIAARDANVHRYFFSSSACVYPKSAQSSPGERALKETDTYPADPEDGYGWEKLFSERMCMNMSEDYGLETRVARYHNVYGSMGSWQGGREKAPAAICRKVAEAKRDGTKHIEIWGDGEQTRSFLHIEDCIRGTQSVMKGAYREPFNIGSEELVSINQLVSMVEEIAGIKLERQYKAGAATGVRGRNSDNSLAASKLGWVPSVRLRDGLEEIYAWIDNQLCQLK